MIARDIENIYNNHSMPLNEHSVGIKDAECSFWPLYLSFLSSLTCGREMLRVIVCPVGKAKSGPDCLLSFKQWGLKVNTLPVSVR